MNYQNEEIYGIDTVFGEVNGYEGKNVRDLIEESGSRDIFKLIKRGYRFDDEVLKSCHISKTVRDESVYNEFAEHLKPKTNKVYKKDTASYEDIVESLSNVEIDENEEYEEVEDETSEFYSNDDE